MPDLAGYSFGRYHLIEQLGEGGMATVYKAFDTRLERDVAVKVLRVDQFSPAQMEQVLQRFDREAKALGKLSHPNIVSILDYGEYELIPYLVMEYLPGGTLKQKLGTPIPWQEATKTLLPVARALVYAHQHGIVHRDIKPANILLKENGDPILTDFGIAKLLEGVEKGHTLTASGVGIGTPEYMAPEQGMGSKVDARADVYALGTVFYELVTGRKPYIADTPMAVLLKHMTDSLPDPREFAPDLPEQVEKLLLKAMAKQPEDRFETMTALVTAMEGLLNSNAENQLPAATSPTVTAPVVEAPAPVKQTVPTTQTINIKQSPVSRPKQNLPLFIIAGGVIVALLCLVFGFGAYYLFGSIPASGEPTAISNSQATSVISTPALTKAPPFVIEGCSTEEECPDSVAVRDLLPEGTTLEHNIQYKISISPKAKVRFLTGWCAVNTKTLDENLTHMEYVFTVDGESVLGQARKSRGTESFPDDASVTMYCDYMGAVIDKWTPGQTHKIVLGFKIKDSINDGWDTFQPQDDLNIFLIDPDPNVPVPTP